MNTHARAHIFSEEILINLLALNLRSVPLVMRLHPKVMFQTQTCTVTQVRHLAPHSHLYMCIGKPCCYTRCCEHVSSATSVCSDKENVFPQPQLCRNETKQDEFTGPAFTVQTKLPYARKLEDSCHFCNILSMLITRRGLSHLTSAQISFFPFTIIQDYRFASSTRIKAAHKHGILSL